MTIMIIIVNVMLLSSKEENNQAATVIATKVKNAATKLQSVLTLCMYIC